MTEKEKKDYDEFCALIKAADAGKSGAVQKLREYIAAHPRTKEMGDLHANITDTLMKKIAANKSTAEFLTANIDEKKQNLGYSKADALERMMIDRVVMCWLRVTVAEIHCTNLVNTTTTFKESDFADRSLTRASNRFMQACEALERYRVMAEAVKIAKAKANLLEAKVSESKMNKSNAAMRLLKSATG
jgi:hypothetical protein